MDSEMGVTSASAESEPMTMHEATGKLSALLGGSREATPQETVKEDKTPDAETAEVAAEDYDDDQGTAETEEADAEAEKVEAEDADDDSGDELGSDGELITLPDGTQATIEEVTRWRDTRKNLEADFTKKTMALAEQRKQAESKVVELQQKEQFLSQTLPVTIQMLQATMPPAPDPAMLEYDVATYTRQKEAYEGAQRQLQHAYGTLQNMQAQQAQAQQVALEAVIKENQAQLYEAMPELKDATKRQELAGVIEQGLKTYGFEAKDLESVYDYRVIKALSDAVKYQKLMAQKPKVEGKAKNAPPVQKPGKRKSAAEQRAQAKKSQLDQLKQTGSRKDAAGIISQMLSGNR